MFVLKSRQILCTYFYFALRMSFFYNSYIRLQQVVLPRKFRTVTNNIPSFCNGISQSESVPTTPAEDETQTQLNNNHHTTQGLLLTRQALHTYSRNNNLVHYKYNAYSGSCHDLPR